MFRVTGNMKYKVSSEADWLQVILATNVAETSLTVPGVRYIVDSGCVKARSFEAAQALESLQVVPVSQAQARQRSGRAGEIRRPCFLLCLSSTQLQNAASLTLRDVSLP